MGSESRCAMNSFYQNPININDLPSVLTDNLLALDSEFWKTRLDSLKDSFLILRTENWIVCISDKSDVLVKLGIIPSEQVGLLGVKDIIIISETALLSPRKLAAFLNDLRKTTGLNETFELLTDAIKNDLICYREIKRVEKGDIARTDFSEYLRNSKFKILGQHSGLDNEDTSHYDIEIKDQLCNKTAWIQVTIINTLIDDKNDKRVFSVFVTLPRCSPYISAELSSLFNLNWFLKYRFRHVKPDDCLRITYRWGRYEVDDPEEAKREFIRDSMRNSPNDRFPTCPAGYNLEPYDKKDEILCCTMLRQLEEQLFYSVASLNERPDLIKMESFIYWDIGLVRGQIFLYDNRYKLFDLSMIISDEDAHVICLKKLTKLIAKFIKKYSKKDLFPCPVDNFDFFIELLQTGSVLEVIESINEFDKNVKEIATNLDEKYKAPMIVSLAIMANDHLYDEGKPQDEGFKIILIQEYASHMQKQKKSIFDRIKSFLK